VNESIVKIDTEHKENTEQNEHTEQNANGLNDLSDENELNAKKEESEKNESGNKESAEININTNASISMEKIFDKKTFHVKEKKIGFSNNMVECLFIMSNSRYIFYN
jgi:hypothetical protein